jgi:hypothetical protein
VTSPVNIANGVREVTVALQNELIKVIFPDKIANSISVQRKVTVALKKESVKVT